MNKLTDYEVGNALIHRVAENLSELAKDCEESHPDFSHFLANLAGDIGQCGQGLEESDDKDATICAIKHLHVGITDSVRLAWKKIANE